MDCLSGGHVTINVLGTATDGHPVLYDTFYIVQCQFLAELPCAKRASEAPWVRKIGNPSSRENLVMTSPNVRTSIRPSVRTDYGGGEWGLAVALMGERKNPFLTGFLKKRKLITVCCRQTIAEVDLTFLR